MRSSILAAGFTLLLAAVASLNGAVTPQIDRIDRFGTNQLTIHFDTLANRRYELQYLERLSCGTNDSGTCSTNHVPLNLWSNLYVVPKDPFPNHYVIVDYLTNRTRFYRLRITQ